MSKNNKDLSFPPCTTYHESRIHIVQTTPATGSKVEKDESGQYTIVQTKIEYDAGLENVCLEESYVDCKLTPFPLEGYQKHTDAETGKILPLCCTFHKEVFEEASLWFDKFPYCCDLHRKMEKEYWFKKDNYNFMPEKIVTQVAMTEYVIFKKIDKPDWYEAITGYIDHNFLCFGSFAVGLNIYLNNLERSIKFNTLVPADKAQKLVKYINHVGRYYKFSTDWYSNHPLMQHWLEVFPFDIEFMEHLKREFLLFETPLPFDTYNKRIKYEAVLYCLKSESINSHLQKLNKKLLSKIKSSTLYKEGILSDNRTKAELLTGQLDLKYTVQPENASEYVGHLKEWFNDMIELLEDISKLPAKTSSVISHTNKEAQAIDIIESRVTELPERLISFNNRETLERVYDLLKGLFPDREDDIKKALEGRKLEKPLFYQHQQNQLVEFFRRVKYNGFIPDKTAVIKKWLCTNFQFKYKRGGIEEVRWINPTTAHDILSKGIGEPGNKKDRICDVDWLPHKNQSQLQRESQEER